MRKALVVDDSSTVRSIISKMLTEVSMQSVQASNGKEALEMLEKDTEVNLVLVDWNMPIMNGIDFIKNLKANPSYAEIKIIMVTTETEMHQILLALENGVDEYIMKPFTKEIFEEKLKMIGYLGV